MAMKAIITLEDLAALPEALREHYVQRDGHDGVVFLDVAQSELQSKDGKKSVFALEDIHGLRTALQKERDSKSEFERKFKPFEGLDPDDVRGKLKRLEEIGNSPSTDQKHQAAIESLKQQLTQKHQAEIAGLNAKTSQYEKQIERVLVDQAALAALSNHKLMKGGDKLLMPHIKEQIKVVKLDDGSFVARVVDPRDGSVRVSLRPGDNGPMAVDELIDHMSKQEVYSVAFQGTGNSGTKPPSGKQEKGGTPNGGEQDSQSSSNGIHRQIDNPAQRIAEARERSQPAV